MKWKDQGRPKTLDPVGEYRIVVPDTRDVKDEAPGRIGAADFRAVLGPICLYPAIVTRRGLAGVSGTGDNFWYSVDDVPTEPTPYVAHRLRTRWADFEAILQKRV